MATLRDVAKLAGVSEATVSLALRGDQRISEATRRRVLESARTLGYVPNSRARHLASGKTEHVAIVPGVNMRSLFADGFYRVVLDGAGVRLHEEGFSLVLPPQAADVEAIERLVGGKSVDGILLLGDFETAVVDRFLATGVAIVMIDNYVSDRPITAVVNDNTGGVAKAVRHLYDLGHRRIGYIGRFTDVPFGADTFKGYIETMRELGLPYEPDYTYLTTISFEAAYEAMRKLLYVRPPVTGVFAATDLMAMGAIKAITEAGLSIPDDVSVVGMDDTSAALFTQPPLTTVRVHKEEMGRIAADKLLGALRSTGRKGSSSAPEIIMIDNELVVRGSSGPPPADAMADSMAN